MARLTRREFGKWAALSAGIWSAGGCVDLARMQDSAEPARPLGDAGSQPTGPEWRILNRLAYGPRPESVDNLKSAGIDAYIEEQLVPEGIPEDPRLDRKLSQLESLPLDGPELRDYEMAERADDVVMPMFRKLLRGPDLHSTKPGPAAVELQQASVLRATYSRRQLYEVMVDFWTNHFNIDQRKGDCLWLKTIDDRLIRKHALGQFRDLLWASAHSPAMLFYLDNSRNAARNVRTGAAPNENYARELLELHTLGVHSGYTLRDIQEASRCLSGWSVKTSGEWLPGEFVYRASLHDNAAKQVLGQNIPAGQGERDGEQLLELLATHPDTARFICGKLCRRFIADRESPQLVAKLAEVFLRTDGDICEVLRNLFRSSEFTEGQDLKFKRPFDYCISALRALDAETDGLGILPHLERLGQLPFRWPLPDGYPDRTEVWTYGCLARWQFAVDLLSGQIAGTEVPLDDRPSSSALGTVEASERLSRIVLGRTLPAAETEALASLSAAQDSKAATAQQLALLVASPQFQWR